MPPLLATTDRGLYCAAGDFYIDPWRPVERALVTHAHGDHARAGSAHYLCAAAGRTLLERRLPAGAEIAAVGWREGLELGETRVSFHPAGHVRGSAQIRVEHRSTGEVWVASGDYKRAPDPTCAGFEVVPCDTFITEATFALPVYRWPPTAVVAGEVLDWWRANQAAGRASVVFCYALGKAQRLLAELARAAEGSAEEGRPVYVHGAVEPLTELYREDGVVMLPTRPATRQGRRSWAGELVIAPPSAGRSPWMRRFGDAATAFASGWMSVRAARRRRGIDRGFVLSDHADWPALVATIEATGARRVLATHGYREALARYLCEERGLAAEPLETAYTGEPEDD